MATQLVNEKDIFFLDQDFQSKEALFAFVAAKINSQNAPQIVEALLKREAIETTGFGQGVAIPHARLDILDRPRIIMVRLAKPMEWHALDDQPVNLIFFLLVSEKASDQHVELLGDLATNLANETILKKLQTTSDKAIIMTLLANKISQDSLVIDGPTKDKPYYLAVSACTYGLAHTYLVEERLKQYAKAQGYDIKVETHGYKGDLNLITNDDLAKADGLIIAVDRELDLRHLEHLKTIRLRTSDVLKDPKKVFDDLQSSQPINKYKVFLKVDLIKILNWTSNKAFNLCFILGALVGLSLYVTHFESQSNNVFFNTLLDGAQGLAILMPAVLASLFLHYHYRSNQVFVLANFAVLASLSEYFYWDKGFANFGLLGMILSLVIIEILMIGATKINRHFFYQKEVKSRYIENIYYGIKFWINFLIPLILFTIWYFAYESFAQINHDFYHYINAANNYWWFRSIIAAVFLIGMAWDAGGYVNKWCLLISGFLFYDSMAVNIHEIWMTPITATAMGIVLPCAAAWVRNKIVSHIIDSEEKAAGKKMGEAVMRSLSEPFLYYKQRYGNRAAVANILTSIIVGLAIGYTNLAFYGGMNNLFALFFSFSTADYLLIPNIMYFIILAGGALVGGLIHALCYWPNKAKPSTTTEQSKTIRSQNKNEKMKNSLHSANSLG